MTITVKVHRDKNGHKGSYGHLCKGAGLYSSFSKLRSRGIATDDLGICLQGMSFRLQSGSSFLCLFFGDNQLDRRSEPAECRSVRLIVAY